MDICPPLKGPPQLFVPVYVPWNCVIMSSMSNVPVAVEVQLPDIIELIEPTGMVMVKAPVLPLIVPLTMIPFPP